MARQNSKFLKALVVTGTFNACAWRQTSCHPGGGRHFCDHVCSTKPSWQSMSFYCHLSLYHPVVTRMEIKIKNIIDVSSSLSCLFYLLLISKVRSQVKFSSPPGPAVLSNSVMIPQATRNSLEQESHRQLCHFLAKGSGDAASKGNVVGVLACARQVV